MCERLERRPRRMWSPTPKARILVWIGITLTSAPQQNWRYAGSTRNQNYSGKLIFKSWASRNWLLQLTYIPSGLEPNCNQSLDYTNKLLLNSISMWISLFESGNLQSALLPHLIISHYNVGYSWLFYRWFPISIQWILLPSAYFPLVYKPEGI